MAALLVATLKSQGSTVALDWARRLIVEVARVAPAGASAFIKLSQQTQHCCCPALDIPNFASGICGRQKPRHGVWKQRADDH